jgi:hypothetical protein
MQSLPSIFSDENSEFPIVALFVIVDLQTTSIARLVDAFMICTKFRMFSFGDSLLLRN